MAIGLVGPAAAALERASELTKVSVNIGTVGEFADLQEYTLDSNVLTLMDTFTFKLADPGGLRPLAVERGDLVQVYMSDPRVAGGERKQIMLGRVIDVERTVDASGGCTVDVSGGDLGWHLVNSCGPLWKSLMSVSFTYFLKMILDSTWGFAGVATDNEFNRMLQQGLKLNQSRAGIAAARSSFDAFIPPVCFESGELIADKLITYARRAKRLVNVSGDGYLQIYAPNYTQVAAFTLHLHRLDEKPENRLNNVKFPVKTRSSMEGIYTDVVCTWSVAVPSVFPDRFNPHAGTQQSKVSDPNALPFNRLLSFSESDAMTQAMGDDRVLQKFQRGQFDSFVATYQVPGHVLEGKFIAPDTIAGMEDTVNSVRGPHYVASRQLHRSAGGTTTMIQIRKPNLLRA